MTEKHDIDINLAHFENNDQATSAKYLIIKGILIVIYSIILIIILFILIDLETNLFLLILIEFFIFLLLYGTFFRINSKLVRNFKIRNEDEYKKQKEKFLDEFSKLRKIKRRVDYIDLNKKYRKPIIRKCSNCGIVLASFVKQCPNCGEKVFG